MGGVIHDLGMALAAGGVLGGGWGVSVLACHCASVSPNGANSPCKVMVKGGVSHGARRPLPVCPVPPLGQLGPVKLPVGG